VLRLLLLALVSLVLAAPAVAASKPAGEPEMACVHGGGGTIGHSPFHCWCIAWAPTNTTRYRICRIIAWSDGRQTALPPHFRAYTLGPEAHPSCHCKAQWDHRPYVYRSVVYVTVDGRTVTVPSVCRVNPRNGRTWCRIVSTG